MSVLSPTYTEIAERLEDENEQMKSDTLCKVCQTSEVNVLFLPCGHLVACGQVSFSSSFLIFVLSFHLSLPFSSLSLSPLSLLSFPAPFEISQECPV